MGWLRQTTWNTQSAFTKRRRPRATSLLNYKQKCIDKFMYIQVCLASSIIICMYALHVNYPEALSHCGHGHGLTSVAQLSVINNKTLASERFHQNAVDDAL